MKKNLYVIFDCKNGNFGEVLSLTNDKEAIRSFVMSLVGLPDVLGDDLSLYSLGCLNTLDNVPLVTDCLTTQYPSIFNEETEFASRLVCTSRDVEGEVKFYRQKEIELRKLAENIKVDYSAKNFVENVEKLSRFFAKKDKRFNK